jgi:hypothetical protein
MRVKLRQTETPCIFIAHTCDDVTWTYYFIAYWADSWISDKGKVVRVHALKVCEGRRGYIVSFLNSALDKGGVQFHDDATSPLGMKAPRTQGVSGAQSQFIRSEVPLFRPCRHSNQIAQPVANLLYWLSYLGCR